MPISTIESVFFLPGLLCDRAAWERQAQRISDLALSTCVEWDREDSLPAMAETVLRGAPERFSVAGHSMGGRVALEVYRVAPQRVGRIALLDTGFQERPRDASGDEEERGRLALLSLAQSDGMRAMARQWLPPMIHPARLADAALVDGIVDMFARKTPQIFENQIRAHGWRPEGPESGLKS